LQFCIVVCGHKIMSEVWRLRLYKAEGMIAPAKPLWLLRHGLSLDKGACQRIV
jgi:hypothetical protein